MKTMITRERKTVQTKIGRRTKPALIAVAGVTLTHPDRVLYPEQRLTKRDLAAYYESVADWIMPHLIGRPMTLVRCPEGRDKECFYQKHANDTVPHVVDRVQLKEEGGGQATYLMANSIAAVVALVQMGVLEIHTWGARKDRLDRPDRLILDLDPDPALPWRDVLDVTALMRTVLTELGLVSFVKTTGGKGLHIVLPLQRIHTWDEIRSFAKAIADFVAAADPVQVTSTMSKDKRRRKVYIDYLRNARGATAVAAYSTRARAGAPVSVPLAWDELSTDLRSDSFTVRNVGVRLNKLRVDPWEGYYTVNQSLTKAMWDKLH